jgi:hypothetical protein
MVKFFMERTRFELCSAFVAFLLLQQVLGIGEASGVSQTLVSSVSVLVVGLTQILKWQKLLNDRRGPIGVMVLSLAFTVLIAWTQGNFGRQTAIDYVAVFINITFAAAGVFGFTRAAPEAVSSFSKPPDAGAGNSQTA